MQKGAGLAGKASSEVVAHTVKTQKSPGIWPTKFQREN